MNCQTTFCQLIAFSFLMLIANYYMHEITQNVSFTSPLPWIFFYLTSTEGMSAGGYGTLLGNEQTLGEYSVTISFLRLITTLVKV